MAAPAPPIRRGVAERLAAWAVTGPLGHLWSVAADLSTFAGRSLWARARERAQRSG